MVFRSAEVFGYNRAVPSRAYTEAVWSYTDYSSRSFCCRYIPTGSCVEPVSRAISVREWHVGDMAGSCAASE
jgi:hypothetical protein